MHEAFSQDKVRATHLDREACLYVRQSSPRQVVEHAESGLRQYGLRQRAVALGWQEERIRVIDEDQGKSGTLASNRSGFRDLMAGVAAGEVGIVLALEASRLARNNGDWSQLVQVARITDTLLLDEIAVYDPNYPPDMLVLGILGVLAEYELQNQCARMLGGLRHKAARGELRVPLPLGLVYDEDDRVALDPDAEIVAAIASVFAAFRDQGSARQTVRWFREEGLLLPSRATSGPTRGLVRWRTPDLSRITGILRNPSYAGTFAYGRTVTQRQPDGSVRHRTVPREQWAVCIPQHHVGYIEWDEYCRNLETLARNARSFGAGPGRAAAPRNGAALLQGLALCGHCGRRMGVRYTNARPARRQAARAEYVCREPSVRHGLPLCQSIRAAAVDAAVAHFVIEALNRESIELALAVQEQVRADFVAADAARALRVERLSYEAGLAERRYGNVDPANRLVAAKLERKWNESLRALQEAERDREQRRQDREQELAAKQVQRIEELASDFAQVWEAPETKPVDRKRLLGRLVEDATLTRDGYEVAVALRLRGGKALALSPVAIPKPRHLQFPLDRAAAAALDAALDAHTDTEAAEVLNQAGHRLWNGQPYSVQHVYRLRARAGIKGHLQRHREQLREQGYVTAAEMAERLGKSVWTVAEYARQGRILREDIRIGKRTAAMYKLLPDGTESRPEKAKS